MGKNIKSYATTQVHFPQEREGSLMAKGPNLLFTIWYGLTVHIIRFKITSKIFKIVFPSQIPVNYADSVRFAHTARESCKFHTLRTKIQIYVIDFQISDHRQRTQENWSEPTTFHSIRPPITRITRIPCISQ